MEDAINSAKAQLQFLRMRFRRKKREQGTSALITPTEFDHIRRIFLDIENWTTAEDPIGHKIRVNISRKLAQEPMTVGRALDIADEIDAYLLPRIQPYTTDYDQPWVLRRIKELELELARLRSNPALEKKIAEIEKQIAKLKVAPTTSFEGGKKEQEDMLKNYKEADKRVFVIMPFAPIFDDVWKGGIERACNSEDFGYVRVDKISLSSWITEDIVKYIDMADFVITDITANNPNVMFELGWALAKDKKPIVIRQQNDPNRVPFDVKDIRHISYVNSWSGIERLYRDLCKFLKATSKDVNEKPTKERGKKKGDKKTSGK